MKLNCEIIFEQNSIVKFCFNKNFFVNLILSIILKIIQLWKNIIYNWTIILIRAIADNNYNFQLLKKTFCFKKQIEIISILENNSIHSFPNCSLLSDKSQKNLCDLHYKLRNRALNSSIPCIIKKKLRKKSIKFAQSE